MLSRLDIIHILEVLFLQLFHSILILSLQLVQLLAIHLANGAPLIPLVAHCLLIEVDTDLLVLQASGPASFVDHLNQTGAGIATTPFLELGEALHAIFEVLNKLFTDLLSGPLLVEDLRGTSTTQVIYLKPWTLADILRLRYHSQGLLTSSLHLFGNK